MFDLRRLIKKYSRYPAYIIRDMEGYYDYSNGGVWVDGIPYEIILEGAVVPLSNEDLKYDENGTYSSEDRKLYTYTEVAKGEKIRHKDLIYTVQEKKDYTDFDLDLNIYFMKRADVE